MSQAFPAEFLDDFLLEARERLAEVEAALLDIRETPRNERGELLTVVRRGLHTLKGNSGMMGLDRLRDLAHAMEDRLDEVDPTDVPIAEFLKGVDRFRGGLAILAETRQNEALDSGQGDEEIDGQLETEALPAGLRVPFSTVDSLVDRLAELVIAGNRLTEAVSRGRQAGLGRGDNRALWNDVEASEEGLRRVVARIREQVTALRMVPLGTLFAHLRRIVYDEGRARGKQVRFEVRGGETPLDKALLELAHEALGHLVRNAVIHGIERPGERLRLGKPPVGVVEISAEPAGSEVRLAVRDDGSGLDLERLNAEADRRGIEVDGRGDLMSLIAQPGLSTFEGTADKSAGRGMGVAAVQEAVRRHGGRIEVSSEPGEGTRFELRLPLNASILRALLLEVDGERYALPLTAVVESVQISPLSRHEINGAGVLRWRDGVIPMLDLGQVLGSTTAPRGEGHGVIVEGAGRLRAVAVDRQLGIQEIVVRGLDPLLGTPAGLLGATTLGDGSAVLVLDAEALAVASPHHFLAGAQRPGKR